eukprot:tig00000989_g6108.t1
MFEWAERLVGRLSRTVPDCTPTRSVVGAWCVIHVGLAGGVLWSDNALWRAFSDGSWGYVAAFAVVVAVNCWRYFSLVGSDPGYVEVADRVRADDPDADQEAGLLRYAADVGASRAAPPLATLPPYHRFCTPCGIVQPLRSKHCKECNRCVRRFDHHCFWIGTCVGEKNHCRFLWYLITETLVCGWGLLLAGSGLEDRPGFKQWLDDNGFLLICIILILMFGMLPFSLAVYHGFLACSNQTTWEMLKRAKIDYLKAVPENVYPFSRGCWPNLRYFCFSLGRGPPVEWQMPSPEALEAKSKEWNWFSNEYYDCC